MLRPVIATVLLAVVLGIGVLTQAAPVTIPVEVAQFTSSCDALITRAIDTAGTSCSALDRNQACYGNNLVNAQMRPDVTDRFAATGDIASLLSLQKVITAPMDEAAQTWGIAVFKAQANIPDTLPGQNVTFLLFGDTTVDNPSPDMRAVVISTGIGRIACSDAPPSALLIQSPEGQPVTMNINGADVTLGSTIYLTAIANQTMTVATLAGSVGVNAFGGTQTIIPGAQVQLPMGNANGSTDGLSIVGPPGPLEPFDTSQLSRIPLQLLPIPVLLPFPIAGNVNPPPQVSETPTLTPVVASNGCTPRADWTFTYTVRSGDTLSGIAARSGVSLADLQAGNCIANANVVVAGQLLRTPRQVAPPATRVPPTQPPPTNPPRPTNPPEPTAGPTGPNLRADSTSIYQGDCTTVHWDSDNIKEIYFQNQGVPGHSSRQVCPGETTTYPLVVVWKDDSQHQYSITITVNPPPPVCGNGICEPGEDTDTCNTDCFVIG